MVKLRQDTYLDGNLVGSVKDYSVPDFERIGEAYGIKSQQFTDIDEIKASIESGLKHDGPELIDIRITGDATTVEPRLDFNRSFEDMRPYLSEEEMNEQMVIDPIKVS